MNVKNLFIVPLAWFILCSQMLSLIQNFWVEKVLLVWNKISPKPCIPWLKLWNTIFMESTGQNTHPCLSSVTSSIFMWKWGTGVHLVPCCAVTCWEVSDHTWGVQEDTASASGSITASWECSWGLCGTGISPPHSTAANCSNPQRSSHGLPQVKPKACILALTFLKTPNMIIKPHLSWTFQSHWVTSHEEWNIFF